MLIIISFEFFLYYIGYITQTTIRFDLFFGLCIFVTGERVCVCVFVYYFVPKNHVVSGVAELNELSELPSRR